MNPLVPKRILHPCGLECPRWDEILRHPTKGVFDCYCFYCPYRLAGFCEGEYPPADDAVGVKKRGLKF